MRRFDGKVAIITGGARGMGRSHALNLAKEGANVTICDIAKKDPNLDYALAEESEIEKTVKDMETYGVKAIGIQCDVTDSPRVKEVVERTVSEFGKVDFVVANAGIGTYAKFWEMPEPEFDRVMSVNVKGVWLVCKYAAPHMIKKKYGKIVTISSICGLKGLAEMPAYVASKHAVVGLTRAMAIELAPYEINVNTVCPTVIDTPIINNPATYKRWVGRPDATKEDMERVYCNLNLFVNRGMLSPQSVTNAVMWLLSEESRDVTGLALPVDAGLMCK
jgi:SDR family mycofactocin-dependent oxidoreductase